MARKAITFEEESTPRRNPLLSLPPEVLDLIVRQVPYRHDLSMLSQSCKALKSHVFPRLYSHLVLKVPQAWDKLSHFESLLRPTAGEGLRHTASVSIVPQLEDNFGRDLRLSIYSGIRPETHLGDFSTPHPRESVQASLHLNSLVRMLLERVTAHHLTEFTWKHTCFMTGTTLNELLDRQVPGLTKLRIDSYHLDGSDDELMVPDVQSFTINSAGYLLTCPILNTNKASSLRHLCLGAESGVLRHYHEPDGQLQQLHDEWLDGLLDELEDDDEQEVEPTNNSDKLLLQLSTFELKGFDVGKIIKPDSVMLDISSLTSVKLESCHGLEGAFDVLKAEKGKQGLPLRSFHIRQESASPQFRAQLLDFLGSLRGLIHLSVLLETEDPSEPQELEQMLVAPGQSLRSLVWDERRGRRDSFVPQQHISYLSPYQLQAVIARCPNLVELGICIDWRSFTGHVINRLLTPCTLHRIWKLKTLNIRNMPHVNPEKALLPLKELHAAFAATVFKAFFCNSTDDDIDPRAPSAPWTLALGALKYRDVYNGLVDYTCNNMSLDSFLRLQVYRVGTYEFEGRRKPLITHIESGTYEKTEALGGDVKIFQPYWLG